MDRGSYAVQLPGMADALRATTKAEVFDDHCDSHLLLSPGGWLFEKLAGEAAGPDTPSAENATGHYWLVEPEGGGPREVVVLTGDGCRRITNLADLLLSLNQLGPPGQLDAGQFGDAKLKLLG